MVRLGFPFSKRDFLSLRFTYHKTYLDLLTQIQEENEVSKLKKPFYSFYCKKAFIFSLKLCC